MHKTVFRLQKKCCENWASSCTRDTKCWSCKKRLALLLSARSVRTFHSVSTSNGSEITAVTFHNCLETFPGRNAYGLRIKKEYTTSPTLLWNILVASKFCWRLAVQSSRFGCCMRFTTTLMSSTYWKIYESVRTVSKNKSVNSVFGV